jgi:hypothetical protein
MVPTYGKVGKPTASVWARLVGQSYLGCALSPFLACLGPIWAWKGVDREVFALNTPPKFY